MNERLGPPRPENDSIEVPSWRGPHKGIDDASEETEEDESGEEVGVEEREEADEDGAGMVLEDGEEAEEDQGKVLRVVVGSDSPIGVVEELSELSLVRVTSTVGRAIGKMELVEGVGH